MHPFSFCVYMYKFKYAQNQGGRKNKQLFLRIYILQYLLVTVIELF